MEGRRLSTLREFYRIISEGNYLPEWTETTKLELWHDPLR